MTVDVFFRKPTVQVRKDLPPSLSSLAIRMRDRAIARLEDPYAVSSGVVVDDDTLHFLLMWGQDLGDDGSSRVSHVRITDEFTFDELSREPYLELFQPRYNDDRVEISNYDVVSRDSICDGCSRSIWSHRDPLDIRIREPFTMKVAENGSWVAHASLFAVLDNHEILVRPLARHQEYREIELSADCVVDTAVFPVRQSDGLCSACGKGNLVERLDLVEDATSADMIVSREAPLSISVADKAAHLFAGDIEFGRFNSQPYLPYRSYFVSQSLYRSLVDLHVHDVEFRPCRLIRR